MYILWILSNDRPKTRQRKSIFSSLLKKKYNLPLEIGQNSLIKTYYRNGFLSATKRRKKITPRANHFDRSIVFMCHTIDSDCIHLLSPLCIAFNLCGWIRSALHGESSPKEGITNKKYNIPWWECWQVKNRLAAFTDSVSVFYSRHKKGREILFIT